jgi:ribose transport system substrate-binding protein
MAAGAQAQDKKTFALVPKSTNNPFYDQARDGCKKAEAESNGAFECLYIGPGEHGGGDEQAQIVATWSPRASTASQFRPPTPPRWQPPCVTRRPPTSGADLDSDLLPDDKALRIAYVGTHNYEIGTNLANS